MQHGGEALVLCVLFVVLEVPQVPSLAGTLLVFAALALVVLYISTALRLSRLDSRQCVSVVCQLRVKDPVPHLILQVHSKSSSKQYLPLFSSSPYRPHRNSRP